MYAVLEIASQSRHVLTGGPDETKLNGPATPGVQMEVFVLHWPNPLNESRNASEKIPK